MDLFIASKLTVAPPDGWCIMIRECGRACLIPGAPAANRREPIEQACPTHLNRGETFCISLLNSIV